MNPAVLSSIWLPDLPGDAEPKPLPDAHTASLIELILKDRGGLHRVLRTKTLHAALLPRFLGIALTGFVLFGVAMSLVLTVSGHWPELHAIHEWLDHPGTSLLSYESTAGQNAIRPWINGDAERLIAAYAFGLVAASGVCLPSLYFYCLLAGVRMTMADVVVHTVKAKAVSAVALVGILPIYVAVAMGTVIFNADPAFLSVTLGLGLILPCFAGFWGVSSLYEGFADLADLHPARCSEQRKCFLRRLVVSWSVCYTAVMPVMIYSIWEVLGR